MNWTKVFTRQMDLITPKELNFPILIIGAGGIGSFTTLALAKMGCSNITVVDFDNVEPHNTPSQLYTSDQIGEYKVEALQKNIRLFTNTSIQILPLKFEDLGMTEIKTPKVIISAVDSLETRREIWNKIKDNPNWDFYIDARMGGELIRIFVVSPMAPYSIKKYTKKLFDLTVKASEEPCTGRSVVYNTFINAGLIASLVKKYAKRQEVGLQFTFDLTNMLVV